MEAQKKSSAYFSKPFEKGLRVLCLFGPERRDLSLKEIAESLDIDMSSAFRFCHTLVELGFLNKDPRTKLMSLGTKAYAMGLNMARSFNLRQAISPIIDKVYEKYGFTIDSATLDGDILVQVYYRPAQSEPTFQIPGVNPAIHTASFGKAILAFLPEDEMRAIVDRLDLIKRTEHSITDKKVLLAQLRQARQKGYAFNNEEYVIGQIVIGAPFFNLETGRPAGGVSFDFSIINETIESIEKKYAGILLQLAKDISAVIH
jgi:DNA-binding IclR family transcriptional regulator